MNQWLSHQVRQPPRAILAQEVHRDLSDNVEIFCRITCARSASVLLVSDIQASASHLSRDTLQYQWVTFDRLTWFSWQGKHTHLAD